MSFTVENLEFYILIIIRISGFVTVAPFFSMTGVPNRVKAGLAVFLGILTANMLSYTPLEYQGTIGFGLLVVKEMLAGVILGYMASICRYIINFAGEIIDMEIGFSMASSFDPSTNTQVTVTGNYYSYMIMFFLLVTDMHYYLLSAILDSFKLVPVGSVLLDGNMYVIMLQFIVDYFIIGFRIVLPFFAASLMANVVLGVMAKIAPQMNMFAVGMQIKVIIGLFVLLIVVGTLPTVSDFIFSEMRDLTHEIMQVMMPSS